MMKHNIRDFLQLQSTREITPEGFLKAKAIITKVGVQVYRASDFNLGLPNQLINVFRSPATVFNPETINSVKLKSITFDHPMENVDANNYKQYEIGKVGETVEQIDNEHLGASIIINDAEIVRKILNKEIEELSLGYDASIIAETGVYNGQPYDYRFDGAMLINHLAIVEDARCGDSVKILDKGDEEIMKKKMAIKFLKDAGLPENELAAFMKDKNDNADVDSKEFSETMAKALITKGKIKDGSMQEVMPELIKELIPMLEKTMEDPEFQKLLAEELASAFMGGDGEEGGEDKAAVTEPATEPKETVMATSEKHDAAIKLDAAIKDATMKRTQLIETAFLVMDKAVDIHNMDNRKILETVAEKVGVTDAKKKSDEYLHGIIDAMTKERKEAKEIFGKQQHVTDSELSAPISGLAARKLKVVK
jgi:hypothetical protein